MSKDTDKDISEQFDEKMQEGRKTVLAAVVVALTVVLCLAVLDVALRIIIPKTALLNEPVDVQSAEMLHVRLDELRDAEGLKIAVLGDSLVYGRTMRDHGDQDWRSHTLAAQLEVALSDQLNACDINVVNLGMNGLLPSDLNELSRNVMSAGADLIIFDLSLRSFSRDFEKAEAQMSRPWLKTYVHAPEGYFNTSFAMQWRTPGQMIHEALMNSWYLYRIKAHLQSALFDGQPVHFMQRLRNRANNWFNGKDVTQKNVSDDELLLLFKARSRYDKIDLESDNPQVIALNNLLDMLTERKQPFLSFYATENVEIRDELMEPQQFDAWQGQLQSFFETFEASHHWLGVMDLYQPEQYLDHVHLNKDGYKLLADALASQIMKRYAAELGLNSCR